MAVDHVEGHPLAMGLELLMNLLGSVQGHLVQLFDEINVLNASWSDFYLVRFMGMRRLGKVLLAIPV